MVTDIDTVVIIKTKEEIKQIGGSLPMQQDDNDKNLPVIILADLPFPGKI